MRMFKTILAGAVLALGFSGAASAVTISFNDYREGRDLGDTVVATLSAEQVFKGVRFTLTNTSATPLNSFISRLFLAYDGPLGPVQRLNEGGVATSGYWKNAAIDNAGLQFQFAIRFLGTDRLNPGESATFRLRNTTLAGFFQGGGFGMVQVQGLDSMPAPFSSQGGSYAKYTAPQIAPVPLPAAGLMLLGALGGLAALRRRKAA
jgi:hypothetical protein